MADQDNSFGVMHATPIIYCGRCRESFGEVRSNGLLGDFVQCPNQKASERTHVCRVIKPQSGEFWAIAESFIYRYETEFSPMRWNWFGLQFRGHVGTYNTMRTIMILVMAWCASLVFANDMPRVWLFGPAFGAALILMDIMMINTSIVFISRFAASAFRSTFEMIFGYAQFILCFGVFYYCFRFGFSVNMDIGIAYSITYFESVYFSIVSATTLGYGDISPRHDQYMVQALVMIQLLMSLYYGAIILGGVASWINEPKHLKPYRKLHPVEDIRKSST
ncbi:MAG: ion channel [Pseudoruegeria sp.]